MASMLLNCDSVACGTAPESASSNLVHSNDDDYTLYWDVVGRLEV
jgi:hypothetical protein